jgi:hypothetical protein
LAVLLFGLVVAVATSWLSDGDPGAVLGALGISALIFGAIQFGDAKNTIRNLESVSYGLTKTTDNVDGLREELANSTEDLKTQLSTRRVGVFPGFMPKIVELLDSANARIMIFCDFPAYGDFSSSYSREYAAAVRKNATKISLLCLCKEERKNLVNKQISDKSWASWRQEHSKKLREFLERLGTYPLSGLRIDRDELMEILDQRDTQALDGEFKQAKVHETTQVMPLYFWIVDGEEAIFSLAPLIKASALEVGFRTTDSDLIEALEDIFERYRQDATELTNAPSPSSPLPGARAAL